MKTTDYQPRMDTLDVLRSSSSEHASQLLLAALGNPHRTYHSQALQALVQRGDATSARLILASFDRITSEDLPAMMAMRGLMESAILEAFQGGDRRLKHCAVRATAQLECVAAFSRLVEIAEDSVDVLCPLAGKELMDLSMRLGQSARHKKHHTLARAELVRLLRNSICQSEDQPNDAIMHALLGCMHWDDGILSTFLHDPKLPLAVRIQDHLRTSRDLGTLDLLAGLLWRRTSPRCALQILSQRTERELGVLLGRLASARINESVRHHLSLIPCPKSLLAIDPNDKVLPLNILQGVARLIASSDAPPAHVLHTVVVRLLDGSVASRNVAIETLTHYRRLELDDIVNAISSPTEKIKSGGLTIPSLSESMVHLLRLYPDQPPEIQQSIQRFFGDFTCDELFQRLNSWPTELLQLFACIVRILHPEWPEQMHRQVTSPSPKLRSRGLRAVRFMGLTDELWNDAVKLTQDAHDQVRVDAVHAIGNSTQDEAIRLLTELVNDVSTEVCRAARDYLANKVKLLRAQVE